MWVGLRRRVGPRVRSPLRSVETRSGSPGLMALEGSDDELQFALGQITQTSLRQIGPAPLEGGVLLDQLFEGL
jgi:hypothetical protein